MDNTSGGKFIGILKEIIKVMEVERSGSNKEVPIKEEKLDNLDLLRLRLDGESDMLLLSCWCRLITCTALSVTITKLKNNLTETETYTP